MSEGSAKERLRRRIRADQRRISRGERPVYHVSWTLSPDGTLDVTIRELPIVHLFVPDHTGVPDGARGLIAQKLAVDETSFELVSQEAPGRSGPG
jgi:hypothetical protein